MSSKRKVLLVTLSFMLLFVLAFLYLLPSIRFNQYNPVLERSNVYNVKDFVYRSNGEILNENELLDTDKVGHHKQIVHIKKFIFERDVSFIYEVIDTTAPIIDIKENVVYKNPFEEYSISEISNNISINEGTYEIKTNYNPIYCGTYFVEIEARDEYDNVSNAFYEVDVVDNEAPIIFTTGNGKRILKGSNFDVNSIIGYGDNYDKNPSISIEGKINTNKIGSYILHGSATDSSNNVKYWDFIVHVVDKIPKAPDNNYYYPFEKFVEDYKGDNRKFGIDISEWQDEVDFKAIKDAGCEFVFMRIGFSHNGVLTLDKEFKRNIKEAKKVNMPVGIYLFCYDNNEADLLKTLDQMFEELNGEKLELPIVFDWEDFAYFNEYEINFQDLNRLYDLFEKTVEDKGYKSMLYSSKFYLDRIWIYTDKARPTWLAQYTDWPSYEGNYEVWQLSDSGKINGINGHVDFDIMFTND